MTKKMSTEEHDDISDSEITAPEYGLEVVKIASIVRGGKYSTNYRPKDDAEVQALAEDIKEHGLLTEPWTVRDKKGDLHLVAGESRISALELLKETDVRVRVYEADAYGGVQKTATLLRALENSRKEVSFADRVRSVRQMVSARISRSEIATTWHLTEAYVQMIQRWDTKLPPGWEGKLTKNQAEVIAASDHPVAAYEIFLATGELPAKRENSGRGRGAKAANFRAQLVSRYPFAADFPWDKEIVKLTSERHLADFSAFLDRLISLARAGELRTRDVQPGA
jgi:hypothetical protein